MSASSESTPEISASDANSPAAAIESGRRWVGFSEVGWLGLLVAIGWGLAIWHLGLEWKLNVQYQYGWAVPWLALYLAWLRWEDRPAAGSGLGAGPTQWLVVGCALVGGVGLLFREANPDWRLLGWMFAGVALGLTFTAVARLGGRPWIGHFAFPILFFLTAVPWPRPQEAAIMMKLMGGNAELAAEGLRWCGYEALVRGNLVTLPAGTVGVDEACSGVRSLQGAIMISLFLGELWRLSWPRRGVLFLAALGVALGTNTLRTLWLGWSAAQAGTAGVERWHDTAGYTALVACFLLIVAIAALLRNQSAGDAREDRHPPAFASMGRGSVTRGVWWALALFLSSFAATQAWFAWHEQQFTRAVIWRVALPRSIEGYLDKPVSERIRAELRVQDADSGAWQDAQGRRWQASYFEWPAGSNGEQTVLVHDPRVCLQASGMQHLETFPDCVWERGELRLDFEAYRFRDGARDVYVFNTVTSDVVRPSTGAALDGRLTRGSRWEAVVAGIRHLGQRRLEVGIWGAASPQEADRAFREFLDATVRVGSAPDSGD